MQKQSEARRQRIEEMLLEREKESVLNLARDLNVTPETIRKDLDYLERKGFLTRSHGYATIRTSSSDEIPMEFRMQESQDIKKKLSGATFPYIKDNMVIYFPAGSTCLHLARLLTLRKNLTIYTNSIDVVTLLSPTNHHVVLFGGDYSSVGRRTAGLPAIEAMQGIHYDLAISGTCGNLGCDGPASTTYDDGQIENYAIKHARMNILVTEKAKFTQPGIYQWAKYSDFDILITEKLDEKFKETIHVRKEIIEI